MHTATLARAGLAVLLALFVTKAPATAIETNQIYYFSGFCQDCPAVPPAEKEKEPVKGGKLGSPATGVLTLTGYTPGTELANSNFVSFSYTSTIFPELLVTPGNFAAANFPDFEGGISGVLPASAPNPADVAIHWAVEELRLEDGVEVPFLHMFHFVSILEGDWSLCDPKCKAIKKEPGEAPEKVLDFGVAGLWSDTQDAQVPAPGGLPLVLLGIAAALFQRRRPVHTVTA